jgi:hypothetical protein
MDRQPLIPRLKGTQRAAIHPVFMLSTFFFHDSFRD